MSRTGIAGLQLAQGVPPFKYLAYGKAGDVLLLRTNLQGGESMTIPKELSKRIAYTELKDVCGRVISRWEAPWEVDG